jgi:spore maturation protein CgeB
LVQTNNNMKNRMLYFTSWYDEKNPDRRSELEECLRKTVENNEIHAVYLLTENCNPPFYHPKLFPIQTQSRPTYQEFFLRANLIGSEGDILIISNTDLYPDEGFSVYMEKLKQHQCFALCRWDRLPDGQVEFYNHVDSQDVWAFRFPINTDIQSDFFLGKPGCDNAIAERIERVGYEVLGPSKSIKFIHVHNSGIRNYVGETAIPSPYKMVPPEELIIKSPACIEKVLHIGFAQPGLECTFKSKAKHYDFIQWNSYKEVSVLRAEVLSKCQQTQYNLIFLHIQTAGILDVDTLAEMKRLQPNGKIVNWTGDVRKTVEPHYVETGRIVDLTCFSNGNDVETIRTRKVNADYLQIGFNTEIFRPGKAKKHWPEIVFLANHYPNHFPLSDLRYLMAKTLKDTYGDRFGLYGNGWGGMETGNLMGKEVEEADCYRGCKIAISISHFDYKNYYSDRQLRIMGSGACCLVKEYPGCHEDFKNGEEVIFFRDEKDLLAKVEFLLQNEAVRKDIAIKGCKKVHAECTWDNRIDQLLTLL